jgi:ribonuclease P protein component
MIARRYRFHGYNALNFVYKQGRTARSSICLLRYAANPRRTDCRIAVVVSKKVAKSAVQRNRIRRRIYAQIETGAGSLPAYDLVFTVLAVNILEFSEKDIKNTISQLLQTASIEAVDKVGN